MAIHELLAARRDEVMQRWRELVRGGITPEAVPTTELIDHLPKYLDEVIVALTAVAGQPAIDAAEATATAAGHGEQRLRLGFSLDSVVREYGAMRDAIVETARAAGATVTFDELQSIFTSTISGIAHAVSEYTFQRDAELQRQHNEHLGFVAHELRNQLSTAVTACDVLTTRGQLVPDDRGAAILTRSLGRMTELIDHSLQTARASSGLELRREPTQLSALLEDAQANAAAAAEVKHIELAVNVESDAPLMVDVRLVRSALTNLVRNAVKYTHPGGKIAVRGRVAGGHVIVEVEDGCGGIAPGELDQLFATFVRRSDREVGFGLGLAIAKQAIDAHGGTIRVQNLPPNGCVFVVELPVGH